jgi:hypothetical protein
MVLNKAKKEGKVIIKRRDGTTFELKAVNKKDKSPLDVKGINLKLEMEDILDYIQDGRSSKKYKGIKRKV